MNGDVASGTVGTSTAADPQVDDTDSVLVVGDVEHGHADACRSLAGNVESGHRIRGATTGGACADTDDWYTENGSGVFDDLSLSELGIALSDAIVNLGVEEHGGLHVCIDGLPTPEPDTDDELTLFRFAHAVSNRVHGADGTCHVHLDASRDDPLVAKLEPLFDVVVELRENEDGVQARSYSWTDGESQWLPVSSL